MKEIIIIGTLHGGSTSKSELEEVLNEINPDNVLVELSPEELFRYREDSSRDEMFAAYDWATLNNKKVDTFDIENNTLKEGVTGTEVEFVELCTGLEKLVENFSWKEQNTESVWKTPEYTKLNDLLVEKYFIKEKLDERDRILVQNIKDRVIEGKNVIVTGAAHLTYFKEQLPDAIVPFRNE